MRRKDEELIEALKAEWLRSHRLEGKQIDALSSNKAVTTFMCWLLKQQGPIQEDDGVYTPIPKSEVRILDRVLGH